MKCSKDDSADCCGVCGYNPIVVMATHERRYITSININLLRKQKVVPKIVVVCSDNDEVDYYNTFNVTVIKQENIPLGRKWQDGVVKAIAMKADPLIILGSDDILHPDYIRMVLTKMNEGFEFVGCTSWYSYDLPRNILYVSKYIGENTNIPIGSGKAYSATMLEKMRGKVFNQAISKCLDDQGYQLVKKRQGKMYIYHEPMILAVKGGWNELNPIEAYMGVPTIQTDKTDNELLKLFNYDYTPNSVS